jgi:hypothetical protein
MQLNIITPEYLNLYALAYSQVQKKRHRFSLWRLTFLIYIYAKEHK